MKHWRFAWVALVAFASEPSLAESTVRPELPELPIHLQAPFAEISEHRKYSSPEEFEKLLKEYGFELDVIRKTNQVPQVFAVNIPDHLANLPVREKISTFIRLLLPNVVKVKEDIEAVRTEIIALQKKSAGGAQLTDAENEWLAALGKDYGIDQHSFDELLKRVDSIPIGMVLAQGIDESGWGTSHFAVEGNALYGQHLARDGGKYMTSASGGVKVAAFDSIYQSTASYFHNLNSTRAYASFRDTREKLRTEHEAATGHQMVEALADYSQRGQKYVHDLRSLIRHHELDSYGAVSLEDTRDPALVSFVE